MKCDSGRIPQLKLHQWEKFWILPLLTITAATACAVKSLHPSKECELSLSNHQLTLQTMELPGFKQNTASWGQEKWSKIEALGSQAWIEWVLLENFSGVSLNRPS